MHVAERFGPHEFVECAPVVIRWWNDKGVMEMRYGGDVPGVTGLGAGEEAALVVDKMGDDHFDNLLGKFGDRGGARSRNSTGALVEHILRILCRYRYLNRLASSSVAVTAIVVKWGGGGWVV